MSRTALLLASMIAGAVAPGVAQVKNYKPVTEEMLKNPSPDDWLMYSRTYDAQRYSPLKQIDKQNVASARPGMDARAPAGTMEGIPLVHNGVMYVIAPAGAIDALDATNGDLIWEYKHKMQRASAAARIQDHRDLSGRDSVHPRPIPPSWASTPPREAALVRGRSARPHLGRHRRAGQGRYRRNLHRQACGPIATSRPTTL